MSKVNYEAMQIKLEFLYRILQYTNLEGKVKLLLKDEVIEQINSTVATIALNLIYIHRYDDTVILTMEESINARGISQVIAEEFMKLSERLPKEMNEVLPHMRQGRMEIVIRSGIEQIVELLKELIEGKEVIRD